jgi:diguanylate cyclase (GGDEF)-like protein
MARDLSPPETAPRARRATPVADRVFGTDRMLRRALTVVALSALVYAVCIVLMLFGAWRGMYDMGPVPVLIGMMALTPLGFYVVIRSGMSRSLAEPAMTFAQLIAAQTLIGGGYAVTGPIHACNLMLYSAVMIFGMFDMHVRHARIVAAYTICLTGVIMLWRTHTDPLQYVPEQELIYFVLLTTVLSALSQVSVLLTGMRQRLKDQKGKLERALTHIQEMATHDDLTGLANRRHLLDLLNEHALRSARGGVSFYVAMVDLDHFKQINDTHGHAVGDDALRTFARQAQSQLRNTDVIGRWGGEEFLLLMPESPPGDPNVGLERLRSNLATCPASDQVPALRVRFSAGLSRYRDGEAVGDTIERADRAVYAAKAGGRNQTKAL